MSKDNQTRMPSTAKAELLLAAGKAAVSLIPFVGGSAAEVLGAFFGPQIEKRKTAWFERVVSGLEERSRQVVMPEDWWQSEAFTTAFLQASRIAMRTHEQEKLDALRNAVVNVAAGKGPEDDLQVMYFDVMDGLTPCHMQLLAFLSNPSSFGFAEKDETGAPSFPPAQAGEFVARYVSCLANRSQVYELYAGGLVARGLIDAPGAFFGGKPTVDALKSITVTWFGRGFLDFISAPDARQ